MATAPLVPLLTLREAAELAHCSIKTLRNTFKRGDLRVFRMTDAPNAPIRIDPRDLATWIRSRHRQHAPAVRTLAAALAAAEAASDPRAFADGDEAAA